MVILLNPTTKLVPQNKIQIQATENLYRIALTICRNMLRISKFQERLVFYFIQSKHLGKILSPTKN